MAQGLLRRRRLDGLLRPGSERTTRCRENCASYVGAMSGPKRLKHRIVFGVHRQNGCACARSASHEQAARADKALLVRESHCSAAIVGLRPTEPLIEAITQSAGRCAASINASSPAAASIREPESALLRSR